MRPKDDAKLLHPLALGLALLLAGAAGAAASPGDEQGKKGDKREVRRVVVPRTFHWEGEWAPRGYLGIGLTDLTPELRVHFGVPEGEGVMVSRVESGSPAEKAGVKVGDIVSAVDGEKVESSLDVRMKVRAAEEGAQVPIEVWRGGKVQTLSATVEKRDKPELDLAPFFWKKEDGDKLMLHLDEGKLKEMRIPLLVGPGMKGGLLRSEREEELEKRLKELEKRLQELERQLAKRN